ncbi:ethanolamine ammonia-lyase reactivating factor EutA [Clostridium saccharobutylicum]|uniref:ethanolamine ammonia-lyase reactivating factor EutA n=1 Tax=Clostridium saccharobutylicum TaxID=169679 RepID=UPI0005A216E2|nr:ethanolamine ammonia-lyase reactivating factor EutA [Clostridium saccharobutylicum]MBC2400369.1 ethanolamine utilization protein EutA [Clostridium saccharobutylicum]MBC2411131.1 ethanolamine utilization protein EutA [Clostridium saccharobutylicum]MBC2435066.1 ethanolamine utilization protein EutA [Clostridium saccharobutylicum]MBC2439194.1 ethanolamine utilization protein EutA [Clostridium saccharobutylicum]MBC2443233.1 ethanolamine utilization protein EutA [Clostridium saccharobutylicum]
MLKSEIYSIGVDIGTSTTEVIISKLKIKNVLSSSLIRETVIEDKEIVYKSPIVFTPLLDEITIDFAKIKDIVSEAIELSKVEINHISTGAVIITGETARKENANEVSRNLSEYLGDFVVATAGPKLESLLAGFGSGAADMSKKLNRRIINLDIGGGTTNVSIFNCGECEQTFALDIGGRLIKFNQEGKVIYISKRIEFLIKDMNIDIQIGKRIEIKNLKVLCEKLAESLLEVCCLKNLCEDTKKLFISEEFEKFEVDYISFSGGIGEYIGQYNKEIEFNDVFKHGDIGPILGACISNVFKNYKDSLLSSKEKIRATVIGAGNHSLTISGSTIAFDKSILPIKNIPIIKPFNKEENLEDIYFLGKKKCEMYEDTCVAISLVGPKSPSYGEIKVIASEIIRLFEEIKGPIIVILENDFAKALGQVISLSLKEKREVICIDKISTKNGDYIDIGLPIGNAIPVVIKTLIYNS